MAQQPIDYSINAPEAYKSVLSGFQTGLNINDLHGIQIISIEFFDIALNHLLFCYRIQKVFN